MATYFGVTRDRARDWLNPIRRREVELARRRGHRAPCAWCGGPLCPLPGDVERLRQSGVCKPCRMARSAGRNRTVRALWIAGVPMQEIAAAIRSTTNSLSTRMGRMRAAGVDLPYRPSYPRRR